MSAEVAQNPSRNFKYSFPTCTNEDILFKLEVPVEIPYAGCTRELVQRVINMFHIPVYLEDDLNEKLADFVATETKNFHNDRDEKLINQLKNSELNVDGVVKNWERMFKENVMEFAEQKGTSDEEVFAAAYHKLVHSPALETILQVENSYAKTVSNMLKSRDEDVQKITERQTAEMEENMRLLNTTVTEDDINELAARHFEEQSLARGRWGSQLDALRQTQRAQHRAWLMATLDHYPNDTPSNSPIGAFPAGRLLAPEPAPAPCPSPAPHPRLEESFTIHLGSQLKQTHNVRIVAMDLLDLCRLQPDNPTCEMRRLQTSLGLYSSELSAVVLLSSADASSTELLSAADARSGEPLRALQHAAAAAPDHHFASLDMQLKEILEKVKEPAEQRNSSRAEPRRSRRALAAGDVLVTRHAHLPDVHVVFHLVADADALSGEMSSRHPVMLGLRNILKAACANDITSISLPLLLRHDLSEETTAAWCVRRAELVLKCVKGFVLEACGWGGARPATLQVAAPPSTQPQVFSQLAQLLPAIFRVSAPVKAKQPTAH